MYDMMRHPYTKNTCFIIMIMNITASTPMQDLQLA